MTNAGICVVCGSLRAASHNRRLAAEAARLLSLTDAVVTQIDLADYPLPFYDGDHESEHGVPQNAVLMAQRIAAQDGLVLVGPEYNHSLPPVMKNAIDWISRVRRVEGRPIHAFKGLHVALASASPGATGGMRALEAWRIVMRALGAEVLTRQVALGGAASGFDEMGRLRDEATASRLDEMVDALIERSRTLGRNVAG